MKGPVFQIKRDKVHRIYPLIGRSNGRVDTKNNCWVLVAGYGGLSRTNHKSTELGCLGWESKTRRGQMTTYSSLITIQTYGTPFISLNTTAFCPLGLHTYLPPAQSNISLLFSLFLSNFTHPSDLTSPQKNSLTFQTSLRPPITLSHSILHFGSIRGN